MLSLITSSRPWTKAEIREYAENYIGAIQTHGDEPLLIRTNDATQLGLLPAGYDTSGADSYRNNVYLPRALSAGELAHKLSVLSGRLEALLAILSAMATYRQALDVLESDGAPAQQIEAEAGVLVDNPVYVELISQRDNALSVIDDASAEDWRLIAQRVAGAEIADSVELDLAVIRVLPTIEALEAYVEGEGLGSIDKRRNLETERQRIIDALTPDVESEVDTDVV